MVAAARELPVGSIRLIVKATHSFFRDKEIDEFFVSLFIEQKKDPFSFHIMYFQDYCFHFVVLMLPRYLMVELYP